MNAGSGTSSTVASWTGCMILLSLASLISKIEEMRMMIEYLTHKIVMRIKRTVHPKCSCDDWYIGTQHIIIIIWNFFLKPLTSIDEIKEHVNFPWAQYLLSLLLKSQWKASNGEWMGLLSSRHCSHWQSASSSRCDRLCKDGWRRARRKAFWTRRFLFDSLQRGADGVGGWSLIQL